jgi:hypothetical protein
MAQEIAHGVERHAELHEARGEVVAQIMPTKAHNIRALQDLSPRCLEPRRDLEYPCSVARLFSPGLQDLDCLVIERHVARLATLGIRALDGEKPAGEINRSPS